MSALVLLLGSASVFFVLQAAWWMRASRQAAVDSVIAERLLISDAVSDAEGLLRGGARGDWTDNVPGIHALRALLEEAGADESVGAYFVRSAVLGLLTFALIAGVTSNAAGALILAFAGCVAPWLGVLGQRAKRTARVEEQLPEALEVMAISLRAGHSLEQTLRFSSEELQGPIAEELRRVSEEVQLGRPLDAALVAMSERMRGARSVRTFVVSVLVLRQTGGNLVEVLESIIDTLRQSSQYARKLNAMTAEGRSSARMLAALPIIFVTLSYAANPKYISMLLVDPTGRSILALAATLYVTGLLWIRRLVSHRS